MSRKKATSTSNVSRLVFLWFFTLALLVAVVFKQKGFSVERGFDSANREVTEEADKPIGKLNFDAEAKFVYQVSVPDNYVRKTNKELAGVGYPREILSIDDDKLRRLECGPVYVSGESGMETYVRGVKSNLSRDSDEYKLFESGQALIGKLDYLWSCRVDDGSRLSGMGGTLNSGSSVHFIRWGRRELELSLDNTGRCDRVLAAKTDGRAYLRCETQSIGSVVSAIFMMDFEQKKVSKLMSCEQSSAAMGRAANIKCTN